MGEKREEIEENLETCSPAAHTKGGGRFRRSTPAAEFAVVAGSASSGRRWRLAGGVAAGARARRALGRRMAARSALLWGSAGRPRRRPWPGRGRPLPVGRMGRRGRAGQVRVEPTGSAKVDRKWFFSKYFSCAKINPELAR
jgi:hypothetical protein